MNRLIYIFIITIILVALIFTYTPNNKYLDVYENVFTLEYIIGEECNLSYSIKGESLTLEKKDEKKETISWKFSSMSSGYSTIKINCRKKDSDKSEYSVTYEFRVIKNKIFWLKGDALGVLDFPNPK